uniref:Serine protease HTRA2, mitochondrial n=1 Tax=Phallusia mammillata TaxID=59560 RepID=A0A6F9DE72_9ASCI|nr:serine protease HTRA1-like [Phallusia mammillata]
MSSSFTSKILNCVVRNPKNLKQVANSCKISVKPVTSLTRCIQTSGSNRKEETDNKKRHGTWVALLGGGITAFMLNEFRKQHVVYATNIDPASQFMGSGNQPPSNRPSRRAMFNFIADVVNMSSPAVVHIERTVRVPFTRSSVPISNGSGFVVDSNGTKLIITNAHVVGNQAQVKVKLQDGRQFEGKVVGIDEARDIAAVQINCPNLPHLPLGSVRDLRPGEWVVAMGSPLALSNTVTAGIISNMCRAGKELGLREEEKRDMEYIQTDATINVGNSGGPLVNLDGQVIGINTMMASAGIGFAIPIDYVQEFLNELRGLQQGRVPASMRRSQRWIGITMLTLTPEIIMQLKIRKSDFPDVSEGVLVHKVQHDSPAYMGGMQDGDVITHINGNRVFSSKDVFDALKRSQVLNITIKRQTRNIVLRVVAEEIVH